MKSKLLAAYAILASFLIVLLGAGLARAHCDGLDGPVVNAARKALRTNNVNLVLVWVQKGSEQELKSAFASTMAVRKLNADSRALADNAFFETLVRLHRSGEGAPYTGLKPAGRDLGPAIPAADRAIQIGNADAMEALLIKELRTGLRHAFTEVREKRNYDENDVAAGREYVKAYVAYVHFVERVYEGLTHASGGHYAEGETAAPSVHSK
jgi:hypothetical protein